MSAENEHVRDLLTGVMKLVDAIDEGVRTGYLQDGDGTLTELAIELREDAARVELILDPEPEDAKSFIGGEDDHLEAQVENDLGDIEPGDVSFGSDNAGW